MRPNPKDEAIEIVNKMVLEFPLQNNTNANVYYIAKQCALIAVEYLITNEHLETGDESWWKRVKQEIEKL